MATIKYLIRGKQELSTIYVRLRDGRDTDLTTSTGYTINPFLWNDKKGEVRQLSENSNKLNLSNNLRDLKRKIEDTLNEEKGRCEINSDWLKHTIQKYKNPYLENEDLFLIDLIRNYQDVLRSRTNVKTGKPISTITIKNFNTTISRLKKFEEYKMKKYLIHEVDLTFHSNYSKFAKENLGLSVNSYGKDLKQIKTVCLDARDRNIKINSQVESRKFNAPKEKTSFVTLNESELNKIRNVKGSDYILNARDWLLVGCWTGCRVNDLMKLNNSNILKGIDGWQFIRYVQSKTGNQVDLPIHPHVLEVLSKYDGFPRPISDQKFNKYIKEVCEKAGIVEVVNGTRQNPKTHRKETGMFEKWQLIRSHTCRRSFATNHYSQLSNKQIMAVTGHKTEKQFLDYIGEVDSTHIEGFLTLWNSKKPIDNVKSISVG